MRSRAFLPLVLFAFVSTAEPATVSIKQKPITHNEPPVEISGALESKPEASIISRAGDWQLLSLLAEYMRFPAAMLGDSQKSFHMDVSLQSDRTWRQNLLKIGSVIGEFQARPHRGFMEIQWWSSEKSDRIKAEMSKIVPPIVFSSKYASDSLNMWHEVSGLDFRYDEDLVQNSDAWETHLARQREIESVREDTHGTGNVEFCSPTELPLEEFMSKLAVHLGGSALKSGDSWVLVPFQRSSESTKTISALLAEIKEGFTHPDKDAIESLQRMGKLALPELLTELNTAEGRYAISLIHILSAIPSPERDEAFLKYAEKLESPERKSWLVWRDEVTLELLSAFAESKFPPAIPLLERYASESFPDRTLRFYARIALNILGRPFPPKAQTEVMKISPDMIPVLQMGKAKQFFPIAFAVIEQGPFSYGSELFIAEEIKAGGFGFQGRDDKGSQVWAIRVARVNGDEALVTIGAFYGYFAKLRRVDGRWLLIDWQLLWVQ